MFVKITIVCVAVLSLVGNVLAASPQWNGTVSNSWNLGANWSTNSVPASGDFIYITKTSGPIVDFNTAAGLYIRVGGSSDAKLTVNSGTLNVSEYMMIGTDTGGNLGTFTLNGGAVNLGCSNPVNGHLEIGYTSDSSGGFIMNGGVINVPGKLGIGWVVGATGVVHLNGGTITAGSFSMTSTSLMDITNGKLIINGNVSGYIAGCKAYGWLTGRGSSANVQYDYNITNPGKTTVTAVYHGQAINPVPANGASDVSAIATLGWTAGPTATSHNVYFGTTSPGTYRGNRTAAAFDPGPLAFNTTYYWRIDEVSGPNTVTGDVWSFTTLSGVAANPSPALGTSGVAFNTILTWTPGPYAASHDVYLGTDVNSVRNAGRLVGDLDASGQVDFNDLLILIGDWLENPAGSQPYAGVTDSNVVNFTDYAMMAGNWQVPPNPIFKGTFSTPNYSPGLTPGTTYYWRVDEVDGGQIRKGNIWSFKTVDTNTLVGKVMCGYQGWFNCPGDGTTRNWVHWLNSGSTTFSPTNCHVDLWPDVNELTDGEKFAATNFNDAAGTHYVFSSHNLATVQRHFKWMRDYSIDGIFLQRFANEIKDQVSATFYDRNDVLDYCRSGANTYGRVYAVMYDLSGLKAGQTSYVINDWKYLVDTKKLTKDPNDHAYVHHKGKPVVAVWGIGFNDGRKYTLQECLTLVNFLKNDPTYGGNTVMVGVPSYWRTLDNTKDCLPDPNLYAIIQAADIVSPWSVGRYADADVSSYAIQVWNQDVIWCEDRGLDYMPVIWPGYSHYNASGQTAALDQYPRLGGQFLWDQVNPVIAAGATMIYQAMFDEADEGTAIFKVTNNPPKPGGATMFLTYQGLPSDEYLWLVGQAGRALRGEIPLTQTRPAR